MYIFILKNKILCKYFKSKVLLKNKLFFYFSFKLFNLKIKIILLMIIYNEISWYIIIILNYYNNFFKIFILNFIKIFVIQIIIILDHNDTFIKI